MATHEKIAPAGACGFCDLPASYDVQVDTEDYCGYEYIPVCEVHMTLFCLNCDAPVPGHADWPGYCCGQCVRDRGDADDNEENGLDDDDYRENETGPDPYDPGWACRKDN